MLIFREKEILSVAKSAFIENADFISTQKWCKNRLCNGILFRKKDVFFEKIGIHKTEINTGKLKRTYDTLSRGNLFDSFSLLGEYSQKLTLREKSTIGTMLAPKTLSACRRKDIRKPFIRFFGKRFLLLCRSMQIFGRTLE